MMRLIVISRVLKYRAFFIAILLLSTLVFFQSNQALDDSVEVPTKEETEKSQTDNTQTPSVSETTETENGENESDTVDSQTNSTSRVSISITNTVDSNSNEQNSGETTIEEIKREVSGGSISLSFRSSGGEQDIDEEIEEDNGKTSVEFSSRTKNKTKTRSDLEFKYEEEIEND